MTNTSIQNAPRIAIPLQQTPYIDKAAPLQGTPNGVDVPPEIAKGNTGNITFNGGPALLINDPSIQGVPEYGLAEKLSAAFLNGFASGSPVGAAKDFINSLSDTELSTVTKDFINSMPDTLFPSDGKELINSLPDSTLATNIRNNVNSLSSTELAAEVKEITDSLSDEQAVSTVKNVLNSLLGKTKLPDEVINMAVNFGKQNNMSLEDVVMELMICQLKGALDMKSAERQMKADLSADQYKRGMEIANLIKDKGQKEFTSAMVQTVSQVASGLGAIASRKIIKALMSHGPNNKFAADASNNSGNYSKVNFMTESEKMNMQQTMALGSDMTSQGIKSAGDIASAALRLQSNQDDVQIKRLETESKLTDSITSSIDSAISSQNGAVQFYQNMLQTIGSLLYDAARNIISNSR